MIRELVADDVPAVLQLIHDLAAYEREPAAVVATEADLRAALLGSDPVAHCLIAELDGAIVGFALWYRTFSTWLGQPGLWLEDLFVQPAARGQGLGKALLIELARICTANGWPRFEWWVLDWNVDAQGFYRSVGARPEDEWTVWRVDGEALQRLGSED